MANPPTFHDGEKTPETRTTLGFSEFNVHDYFVIPLQNPLRAAESADVFPASVWSGEVLAICNNSKTFECLAHKNTNLYT